MRDVGNLVKHTYTHTRSKDTITLCTSMNIFIHLVDSIQLYFCFDIYFSWY